MLPLLESPRRPIPRMLEYRPREHVRSTEIREQVMRLECVQQLADKRHHAHSGRRLTEWRTDLRQGGRRTFHHRLEKL
jgi:hypothetical protein